MRTLLLSAGRLASLVWMVFVIWFLLRYLRFWTDSFTSLTAMAALVVAMMQAAAAALVLVAIHARVRARRWIARIAWSCIVAVVGACLWFVLTVQALKLGVWASLRYGMAERVNNVIQFFYGDYSHTGWVLGVLLVYFVAIAVHSRGSHFDVAKHS